jgi:hypothetical protein
MPCRAAFSWSSSKRSSVGRRLGAGVDVDDAGFAREARGERARGGVEFVPGWRRAGRAPRRPGSPSPADPGGSSTTFRWPAAVARGQQQLAHAQRDAVALVLAVVLAEQVEAQFAELGRGRR